MITPHCKLRMGHRATALEEDVNKGKLLLRPRRDMRMVGMQIRMPPRVEKHGDISPMVLGQIRQLRRIPLAPY